MIRPSLGRGGVFVAVAACTALLAACSSSSSTSTGSSPSVTSTASSSSSSGSTAASGNPISIGFINQEYGSEGASPEANSAVQAAASYINNELGGVGGRPIKIVSCGTDGTLASDQNCAQQMVIDKVAFVQGGLSFNSASWYPILKQAGIPVIGSTPLSPPEFSTTDGFNFDSGTALSSAALASYVAKLPNVKTVSIVVNDVPASLAQVPSFEAVLSSFGVKSKVVEYSASATSLLSTYVEAELGSNAILANLATPNCITFAEAAASQNNKLPVVFQGTCNSPSVYQAAGDKLNGWVTDLAFGDPTGNTSDARTFQAAMKKYAPSAAIDEFSQLAFADLMTVYLNVLKPLGPNGITSAALVKQVTDSAGGQVFMGPTYKCPGSVMPAICTSSIVYAKVDGPNFDYDSDFTNVGPQFAISLGIKS
jgi:branched-chain amino acid transport system substrate-binding protein